MKTVSILVADDHPVVRRGVRALLEANRNWKVVAEAHDGRQALLKARHIRPDLAILDIGMPLLNGIEAARRIARYSLNTRIIIFSMYDSEEIIQKAIHSGAHGFVRKSEAETELIAAANAVLNNKLFFPATALAMLRRTSKNEHSSSAPSLSAREAEVLQLIAEGKSNKETASILGISQRTVENHRARIMRKVGARSYSELVRYAVRHKVVAA